MVERLVTQHNGVGYSPGEQAALKDLFQSLTKGIKASRQYPPEHPIATQFRSQFFEKLKNVFEGGEALGVTVTQDSLLVEEEVVLKGAVASDNIAQLLHRDGIRFLEITPFVTEEEASAFFGALVACSGRDENAEDIVNLFWQAGFEHITYDVVDVFEVAEVHELREEFDSTRTVPQTVEVLPPDIQEQLPTLSDMLIDRYSDVASFSRDELVALRKMVDDDRKLNIKEQAIELLLLLCESTTSPQDLAMTYDALQSIFDKTIQEANFTTMNHILNQVKELIKTGPREESGSGKRLGEFVSRCGDSLRIKMITEALNQHEDQDLEPARQYLESLGWESFNNLLWMLGELTFFPARKMVCDLLAEKGLDRIDLLGSAVFDSRWYLVRNVVWVLGETGHPRALSFLRRVAAHSDVRIRGEVVKALAKITDPGKTELLLALLEDDSQQIRIAAADALGGSRSDDAYEGLSKIINTREFLDAPPEEMRKIVEAMVVAGGPRAVLMVRDILSRNRLFNRGPIRMLQDTALNALKRSPTTEADELLAELAENTRSRYSSIASKILALRERWRKGGTDGESE